MEPFFRPTSKLPFKMSILLTKDAPRSTNFSNLNSPFCAEIMAIFLSLPPEMR
jgi:hypothetical protein